MQPNKKAPSTESVLAEARKELEAIRKQLGTVPQLPQEQLEAMFRNQLRMRSSTK